MIRSLILAQARATIGLSAAPSLLARFERFLGDGEPPGVAHDMATRKGTSTCWLSLRRWLFLAGLIARFTRPPYEYLPGTAGSISGALADARAAGAWVDAGDDRMPLDGDALYLEADGKPSDWHVCLVERVVSATELVTIEGGQVSRARGTAPDDPGGMQMIARKIQTWRRAGAKVFARSRFERPDLGFDGAEKRVVGWIDVEKLAAYVAAQGGGTAPATPTPTSPTSALLAAPHDTPTLRRGSTGAGVRRWQALAGGVKVDGDFGPATDARTRVVQRELGVKADGIVGPTTWRAALARAETPAPAAPPRVRLECLDIADHQSAGWDVARVRDAGIAAVWSRATDGVDWIDPGFADNVAQTRRIGAEPGAYHFARVRHGRPQDAAEQARQHVAAARAHGIRIASWVDAEHGPKGDQRFTEHNAATREEWHVALWDALEGIERASGIPPKLYTFVAFLAWLQLPAKFTRWGLVIADYRGGRTAPGEPEGLAPWGTDDWEGWQYAAGPQGGGNVGRVDGVPIPIDRSVWRRSLAELGAR